MVKLCIIYINCRNRGIPGPTFTLPALTSNLTPAVNQVKLLKEHSSESGRSWRLGAGSIPNSGGGAELEAALAEARQQLSSWEQDVLSLEFVATHESFEDVADLDMTYNNSHLEVSILVAYGMATVPNK